MKIYVNNLALLKPLVIKLLQQQLADLNKAVQAMAAPPAPPPAATSGTNSQAGVTGGPPPNIPPATILYDNANRDANPRRLLLKHSS